MRYSYKMKYIKSKHCNFNFKFQYRLMICFYPSNKNIFVTPPPPLVKWPRKII